MKKMESCPRCKILGASLFVDWDEDQHFPEEVRKVEMVMWFDEWHNLRRCPQCGTYYDFRYNIDNDIIQPTH